MARATMTYQEAVQAVTGEMTYEQWRETLRQANVDILTTINSARSSGDLRFYNVRGEDGRRVPMVAPRQAEPTTGGGQVIG